MYFANYIVYDSFSKFIDLSDPNISSINKKDFNGILFCYDKKIKISDSLLKMKAVYDKLSEYEIFHWKGIVGDGIGETYETYEEVASIKNVVQVKTILVKYEVFNKITDPKEKEQICFDPIRWICDNVFNGNLIATHTPSFRKSDKNTIPFPIPSDVIQTEHSIAIDEMKRVENEVRKKRLSRFLKSFGK